VPHFRSVDDALGPVEGSFMRAKLHIRGGKQRLRDGKISMGILTLYDAVVSAMEGYVASPGHRNKLKIHAGEDMNNDNTLYSVLTRSGVLDGTFDYAKFNNIVELALKQELSSFDYSGILKGVERVMTQLGVMPFDESQLPPEDPEA
jgi:hypothetical protein